MELQEIVANAIQQLGRKRAVVITGPDNMDEAAPLWHQHLHPFGRWSHQPAHFHL